MFVFGDLSIFHKDWLTYSGGNDRPGELCYFFQTTLLRWLTVLYPDLRQSLFFLSTMAFPPLRNSDHVVVSVSIDFPTNSQQDAPFHRIAYDYSRANWDGLRDHLRDVPLEDIFKLSASAAAG